MASASYLRSRRSAAQLHALEGVEREIRANDPNGRRKYLKDFSAAYRTYEAVLSPAQLRENILAASLILIGDYHALPACQRFAGSVLEQRAMAGEGPVVLGLDGINTFSTSGGGGRSRRTSYVHGSASNWTGATSGIPSTSCW